jgi:hypothetical protein
MITAGAAVVVVEAVRLKVMPTEPRFLEDKPRQPGRPTRLTRKLAEKAYFLTRHGHTDRDVCFVLGVAESTFNLWKKNLTFFGTLLACKREIDQRVEQALLRLAVGSSVREQKIVRNRDGGIIRTEEIDREVLPDFNSARLWLRNRHPERWGGAVHCECHRFPVASSSNGQAPAEASNGNGRL